MKEEKKNEHVLQYTSFNNITAIRENPTHVPKTSELFRLNLSYRIIYFPLYTIKLSKVIRCTHESFNNLCMYKYAVCNNKRSKVYMSPLDNFSYIYISLSCVLYNVILHHFVTRIEVTYRNEYVFSSFSAGLYKCRHQVPESHDSRNASTTVGVRQEVSFTAKH